MDTVRRPLCGCFVLSCMVGGIVENPRAFGRCLPPARPEKAWPFQAGRSPCTKHPQDCPALPLRPEKSFLGFQGAFFQKRSLAGGGTASHKESEPIWPGAPFQAGRSPFTKHLQTVRLLLYKPKKVFEGSKGRFFKNAPLAGGGTGSHKRRGRASPTGCAFSGGTRAFHETPTDRQALPLHTEKVFEGSKGRFFKNAPLAGGGTGSHKRRGRASPTGYTFSGGTKSFHETPTDRPALPLRTEKKFLGVPRGVFSKTHPWQGVGRRPTKRERTG